MYAIYEQTRTLCVLQNGSHNVKVYSMMGLTRVSYSSSLMPLGHCLRFRWRNAREPIAFLTAISVSLFQV